jgi:hypothetical protein
MQDTKTDDTDGLEVSVALRQRLPQPCFVCMGQQCCPFPPPPPPPLFQVALAVVAVQATKGLTNPAAVDAAIQVAVTKPSTGLSL